MGEQLSNPAEKTPRRKRCPSCGQLKHDVTLDEDPYAAEINDDHTEVWMCGECRYERLMDI